MPNRILVDFSLIDAYLLDGAVDKKRLVATLLAERADVAAAAPFYRALEAVGPRAADEAFLALRLVLAGHPPSDTLVRRLRALSAIARAAQGSDRRSVQRLRERDASVLSDLPTDEDLPALAESARRAYARELGRDPRVQS